MKAQRLAQRSLWINIDRIELLDLGPGETFLVIDPERHDYIWMNLGWQNGERVTGMTVYVRIRDGKFWVEEDWTQDGIATDLMREGVPKEDIVLAFHDPETRKKTAAA